MVAGLGDSRRAYFREWLLPDSRQARIWDRTQPGRCEGAPGTGRDLVGLVNPAAGSRRRAEPRIVRKQPCGFDMADTLVRYGSVSIQYNVLRSLCAFQFEVLHHSGFFSWREAFRL